MPLFVANTHQVSFSSYSTDHPQHFNPVNRFLMIHAVRNHKPTLQLIRLYSATKQFHWILFRQLTLFDQSPVTSIEVQSTFNNRATPKSFIDVNHIRRSPAPNTDNKRRHRNASSKLTSKQKQTSITVRRAVKCYRWRPKRKSQMQTPVVIDSTNRHAISQPIVTSWNLQFSLPNDTTPHCGIVITHLGIVIKSLAPKTPSAQFSNVPINYSSQLYRLTTPMAIRKSQAIPFFIASRCTLHPIAARYSQFFVKRYRQLPFN